MRTVDGIPLTVFPISGLEHVRDLSYFDGPLLSHYEHFNGDDYLYYWCDCDAAANRWMVLRVSEASILRLINQVVPLDFVIPKGCRDDFVYLIDVGESGGIQSAWLVPLPKIPMDYRPKVGTYLDSDCQPWDENSYAVLVEGDWSVHDLGGFPNTFEKAYSFLYSLNVLHVQEIEAFPWRGGFSSYHFFKWTSQRVPAEHKPNVLAIQVASPGFMRFSLHGSTAEQVVQCVSDLKFNNQEIAGAFSDLERYIRDNDLNERVESSLPIDWPKHDKLLEEKAIALMHGFSSIQEKEFYQICPRPFEAAKIAMAFYRFIRDLAMYEKNGQVRYPRTRQATHGLHGAGMMASSQSEQPDDHVHE